MTIAVEPALIAPDGRPVAAPEYPKIPGAPNIEVVGPRLLILPAERREFTTSTGLVIPPNAQEHTNKGIVLLLGDGIMLENGTIIPPRVKVGQEIIYARYAGVELEMDKTKYLIIQESDVRAILSYRGTLFTLE